MSKILDQLPYLDAAAMLAFHDEQIPVLAHHIIVWVSIGLRGDFRLAENSPRIPAILDTGNNFGFSIAADQLGRWCGLQPQILEVLGPIFINRRALPRHAADVWLYRNRRRQRDTFRSVPPFRLELRDGIAIYPAEDLVPAPRLPLLGLRAIDENSLRCTINGEQRTVSLSDTKPA
jgi:hypothetical protein